MAAKCKLGPMPKRCHFCKAEDHLIIECPQRFNKNSVMTHDEENRDGDHSNNLSDAVAKLLLSDENGDDAERESKA